MQPTPFVTDLSANPLTTAYQELSAYLNSIQSKLSYADFKQRIVLLQNYEPLSKIIRRTKALKQEHEEKFKQEDGAFDWYEEERLDSQRYLKKLENMLVGLKGKIEELNWRKQELAGEMEERRAVLKDILKNNRDYVYQLIQNKRISKSLDVSPRGQKRSQSYSNFKNLKQTANIRSRKLSSHTQHSHKTIPTFKTQRSRMSSSFSNKFLFQQCLSQLSKSIKTDSSSNVQGGIFLDILGMGNENPKMTRSKNEPNNLIYEVLLNSYKEQEKKKNEPEKMMIEWETFRRFNGKQIVGLVMVKQKKLDAIKVLCHNWD